MYNVELALEAKGRAVCKVDILMSHDIAQSENKI